jgi:hypothetical protein
MSFATQHYSHATSCTQLATSTIIASTCDCHEQRQSHLSTPQLRPTDFKPSHSNASCRRVIGHILPNVLPSFTGMPLCLFTSPVLSLPVVQSSSSIFLAIIRRAVARTVSQPAALGATRTRFEMICALCSRAPSRKTGPQEPYHERRLPNPAPRPGLTYFAAGRGAMSLYGIGSFGQAPVA